MAYRGFRQAMARSLVAYAYRENNLDNRETAALLARQASRFDPDYAEIEKALHEIFRTEAIVEGRRDLPAFEQVCEKVKFKKALTLKEWKEYTGGGVPYEPACDESQDELRSKMMIVSDVQALSLNLKNNGQPRHFLDNTFERQGDIVIDHATDLMWQQAGSPEELTYEAVEEYIDQLNREEFGGFDGWRLPTVEELLSLLEEKSYEREYFLLSEQSFENLREENIPQDVLERLQSLETKEFYDKVIFLDALQQQIGEEYFDQYSTLILKYTSGKFDLYIDPIFDARQWWCWSADKRQTKDECSSGSAWSVDFHLGYVLWLYFHRDRYVRAVRSRE